jgi:hypothetical protein
MEYICKNTEMILLLFKDKNVNIKIKTRNSIDDFNCMQHTRAMIQRSIAWPCPLGFGDYYIVADPKVTHVIKE